MKLRGTSRKTTSSTPPAAAASAVCCMCGDRGLIEELIRCRTCQFRFQHKYCSNLYPKADRYSTCNWCLKEEIIGGGGGGGGEQSSICDMQNKLVVCSSSSDHGSGRGSRKIELHRSTFAAAEKPIKKTSYVGGKNLSPSTTSSGMIRKTGSSKTSIASSSGRREQQQQQKNGLRGRVKRYKLLEEVFSLSMEYMA